MKRYPGLVEYDAKVGAYGVVFPDLPGCCAMGETLEELYENAGEALRDFVEVMVEDGLDVPEPGPFHCLISVPVGES